MEILHRYTNACLWSGDAETQKEAVLKAVEDGADLSRANLSRADLSGADLAGANLAGADLAGAYLACANLSRADLSRADLSGANLAGANLSRAYLSGADLSGANLAGANLSRADLAGADLAGAKISRILSIGPIGSRGATLVAWLMEDGSRRYSTGCQAQITEDAFLARAQETHRDNIYAQDYLAAVEFAKALHLRHAPPAG